MRKKIGLIGAGNIGSELAYMAARKELGDVWLYDKPSKEGFPQGKALDIAQNSAIEGYDSRIRGTTQWDDLAGADILIITAGIPRKPGQSRDDLVDINLPIMRELGEQIKVHCPDSFVVVISNPLDAMVYECKRSTGFPRERIVGMAGILDSARLQYFVAEELGVSVKDVRAMVLGGHGDDMVPVLSACSVNGVPVTQLLPPERLHALVQRTRTGGGEIVNLMGTSAYFAPAAAAIAMAEAYLHDHKRLLPCAAYLQGEYGYQNLFLGVPVILGAKGVERIVSLPLTQEETTMLQKSAQGVQQLLQRIHTT